MYGLITTKTKICILKRKYKMTKSQNTKNEQQKDLCITSEQLTEQWKKGELPAGCYYIEDAGIYRTVYKSERDDVLEYEHNVYITEMEDCTIIEPVPSYNEWKAKLEENKELKKLLKEIIADADLSYCDSDIELRIDEVLK